MLKHTPKYLVSKATPILAIMRGVSNYRRSAVDFYLSVPQDEKQNTIALHYQK